MVKIEGFYTIYTCEFDSFSHNKSVVLYSLKKKIYGVPLVAQWVKNPTNIHEDTGFDPWPLSVGEGSSVAVNCGVGWQLQL